MKLRDEFIIYETEEDQVLVDVSAKYFSGVVHSNPTAACIVERLQKGATREELLMALQEKYDATEEDFQRDIDLVLSKLKSIHALEDE